MLTQRLGFENQKNPEYIKSLIEIIKRNPGSCDEVWLATDYGFPTLERHRESAKKLGISAGLLSEAGIRVSLQISNTIGHGEYMGIRDCCGLVYDGSGVMPFVDVNGVASEYSFCPHGEKFVEYTKEMIRIYCSEIKPFRVWIDDDFRYDNHSPSGKGCFCDCCLERFNKSYGYSFGRKELSEASKNDISVRASVSEFLCDELCGLAEKLAEAVTSASPKSKLGLQHGAGILPRLGDMKCVFRAFKKGSGADVATRPGAGTYNDHDPSDMITKLDYIRLQKSYVEGETDEIRPEIENFPHVCFGKSAAGTSYESSLYFAGGATAMSYAMMMYDFEPLSFHEEYFKSFSEHRKYWETLSEISKRTYESGLTYYVPDDIWKRKIFGGEGDYAWSDVPWHYGTDIQRCGIPLSYRRKSKSPVYMLTAEMAGCLSEDNVRELIKHPVFCGGDALSILCKNGYGELFGAEAEPISTLLLYEEFTDNEINGSYAGKRWENGLIQRQGAYITDKHGDTVPLGYFGTEGKSVPKAAEGEHPYGIASAIVKTVCGASWLVLGQYPWTSVISRGKLDQIINALDVISGSRIPAVSLGRQQVMLIPREDESMNTVAVTVLNPTVGAAENITLNIRRPYGPNATAYLPNGSVIRLDTEVNGGSVTVRLPEISAWDTCTVILN